MTLALNILVGCFFLLCFVFWDGGGGCHISSAHNSGIKPYFLQDKNKLGCQKKFAVPPVLTTRKSHSWNQLSQVPYFQNVEWGNTEFTTIVLN